MLDLRKPQFSMKLWAGVEWCLSGLTRAEALVPQFLSANLADWTALPRLSTDEKHEGCDWDEKQARYET